MRTRIILTLVVALAYLMGVYIAWASAMEVAKPTFVGGAIMIIILMVVWGAVLPLGSNKVIHLPEGY